MEDKSEGACNLEVKWFVLHFFMQNNSATLALGVENELGLISSNEVDGRKNIQSIKVASSIFIFYPLYRRIIKDKDQTGRE